MEYRAFSNNNNIILLMSRKNKINYNNRCYYYGKRFLKLIEDKKSYEKNLTLLRESLYSRKCFKYSQQK